MKEQALDKYKDIILLSFTASAKYTEKQLHDKTQKYMFGVVAEYLKECIKDGVYYENEYSKTDTFTIIKNRHPKMTNTATFILNEIIVSVYNRFIFGYTSDTCIQRVL